MLGSIIGKRTVNLVKSWAPSGILFGSSAGCAFLYFSDWKAVLQYLPVYNTKFKEDEES